MICLQRVEPKLHLEYVNLKYRFVMCINCVKTCSYRETGPLIVKRLLCSKKLLVTCLARDGDVLNVQELNDFINNSHHLFHRHYHTVPIIFMLSINDVNSLTCVLNHDIIIYIIKFIY